MYHEANGTIDKGLQHSVNGVSILECGDLAWTQSILVREAQQSLLKLGNLVGDNHNQPFWPSDTLSGKHLNVRF